MFDPGAAVNDQAAFRQVRASSQMAVASLAQQPDGQQRRGSV